MLRQPKKEPRVTVIRPLQSHPWGEYSFCIKDPVGNWVEVYQRSEQYRPMGADDGGCYFTDEYTAILFAEDLEKITAFYRDSMQMPVVTSWDRGPEDRAAASALPAALRIFGKRRRTRLRALR